MNCSGIAYRNFERSCQRHAIALAIVMVYILPAPSCAIAEGLFADLYLSRDAVSVVRKSESTWSGQVNMQIFGNRLGYTTPDLSLSNQLSLNFEGALTFRQGIEQSLAPKGENDPYSSGSDVPSTIAASAITGGAQLNYQVDVSEKSAITFFVGAKYSSTYLQGSLFLTHEPDRSEKCSAAVEARSYSDIYDQCDSMRLDTWISDTEMPIGVIWRLDKVGGRNKLDAISFSSSTPLTGYKNEYKIILSNSVRLTLFLFF